MTKKNLKKIKNFHLETKLMTIPNTIKINHLRNIKGVIRDIKMTFQKILNHK